MSGRDPAAVITGASSGIGLELARIFARNGHRVAIVARSADKLEALAGEIEKEGRPRPLVLAIDLEKPDAGDRIDAALAEHNLEPQFVVNNAGFGLVGAAASMPRSEQFAMIDLNIRVLTDLSLRWADSLERHRGGLMNVASVAGFVPGPQSAVYYATKAYVLSFTQALYQEWKTRGIRVTALCPGPVPTGFQARAGVPNRGLPGPAVVTADRVAQEGYRGLMAGRMLVVPGLVNKIIVFLSRVLPRETLLGASDKRQKRRNR
jgi:short-subunit dehydrogenase